MTSSMQHGNADQSDNSYLSYFESDAGSNELGNTAFRDLVSVPQTLTVQTWEEMKQTEDYLAAELYKLTTQEREKALEDIHCVGEGLSETPEMMEKLLEEFDQMVRQVQNPIYQMAVNQNRDYVEDPYFRLRFLRYNMHDVNLAVKQMMDFLKHKATYFGMDKLSREITLDDFNDEDMELLLSGLYHIQKETDRNGRNVLYVMSDVLGRCNIENLIHVAYYMYNSILIPIHDVQMKGVCCVYYDMTKQGEQCAMPGVNFMRTFTNVLMSFPLRQSAFHVCLHPERLDLTLTNTLLSYIFKQLSSYARVRTRLLYGTDMEIQHTLRSHGVSMESFPVDTDGNIRKEILNAWFYAHKKEVEAKKPPAASAFLQQGAEVSHLDHIAQELRVQDLGWELIDSPKSVAESNLDHDAQDSSTQESGGELFDSPKSLADSNLDHDAQESSAKASSGGPIASAQSIGDSNLDRSDAQESSAQASAASTQSLGDSNFDPNAQESSAQKSAGKPLTSARSVGVSNLDYSAAQESKSQEAAAAGTDQSGSAVSHPGEDGGNQRPSVVPSPQDVLLGRGWPVQNHEGNKRFRSFLEGYSDEYDNAARLRKRQIAGDLVHLLRGRGVRFLKQTETGEWILSSFEDAEKKVGQLFRTLRKTNPS